MFFKQCAQPGLIKYFLCFLNWMESPRLTEAIHPPLISFFSSGVWVNPNPNPNPVSKPFSPVCGDAPADARERGGERRSGPGPEVYRGLNLLSLSCDPVRTHCLINAPRTPSEERMVSQTHHPLLTHLRLPPSLPFSTQLPAPGVVPPMQSETRHVAGGKL